MAPEEGGISSVLENITSLYRRSSATLSTLKSACTARHKPPPPSQLDDSIDSAVIDIERELKKGVRRFGSDFENGDDKTIAALSEVERELRTGLFVRVRFATFSENEDIHGPELVDTADWARDRTMLILLKYKNSLWQCDDACPTAQRKSSVATSRSGNSRKSIDMGARKVMRENSIVSDASGDDDTTSGAEDFRNARKRNSSLLGFLKHHRTHSKDVVPGDVTPRPGPDGDMRRAVTMAQIPTSVPASYAPQPDAPRSGSVSTAQGTVRHKDSMIYADWREQLSKIEQSASGHDRHDSSATVRAPSPSPNQAKKMSIAPNAPSKTSIPSGSISLPTPTAENGYLGLCKNAVRLQNGEKKAAFEKRKEFNDGWGQSSVHFLACASSKCAFAGHANIDAIWSKCLTSSSRGLKFRWAFLAKSHVSQTKVTNRQYQFLCLFCLYTCGTSGLFQGTDNLLDHVSSTHRGESFTSILLSKVGGVTDRICEDTEEFDINLFPLNASLEGRKNSTYSNWSDELQLGRTVSHQSHSSASDSVMETLGEEPWNAGLSEFHYKDDYIP